jgi:hypothetical protein
LIFKKEFLSLILLGRKTQTRRTHRRLLRVGHIYTIQVNRTKSTGYYLKVTNLYHQTLKQVKDEEAVREGFNTLDEFKQAWVGINGSWDPRLRVVVYEFELTSPPPKQIKLS